MGLVLYDLAGAEPDRRFSPFCWRAKMAMAHKGLAAETRPWRFTDKEAIAFSGQGLVPVLVDSDHVITDSWQIARYLEDAYPDRPSLFGGPGGRAMSLFVARWADTVVHAGLIRLIVTDIYQHLHAVDRDYFRATRERYFGMSLEELSADREQRVVTFRDSLAPLRVMLRAQPFIGGEAPLYADYVVFGAFQWARSVSDFVLLAPDDPVAAWRARLLEAFDGLAARSAGYPC